METVRSVIQFVCEKHVAISKSANLQPIGKQIKCKVFFY